MYTPFSCAWSRGMDSSWAHGAHMLQQLRTLVSCTNKASVTPSGVRLMLKDSKLLKMKMYLCIKKHLNTYSISSFNMRRSEYLVPDQLVRSGRACRSWPAVYGRSSPAVEQGCMLKVLLLRSEGLIDGEEGRRVPYLTAANGLDLI